MKIAIHHNEGGFSERWISYCQKNNIDYKIVNAYDNDIIKQIDDCTVFMWHHHHANYKDALFAKQLLYSLAQKGIIVFPNFNTNWHFDDKIGQKYLLEAIDAPLVPSYVFYTKEEALKWINKNDFPKVFKLRGGAGSANVRIVKTKLRAKKLVDQAFGKGFPQFDRLGHLKERFSKWIQGKDTLIGVCKGFARLFIPTEFSKIYHREKGYVYFQDFIPNNSFDIRVIIISNRAFALKRLVRRGDFRASGGGNIVYDKNQINEECIRIAFEVNKKIKSQNIAYDFILGENNNPLIVEISYGYSVGAYDKCEGYWDKDMNWYAGENFDFCGWMIESIKQ